MSEHPRSPAKKKDLGFKLLFSLVGQQARRHPLQYALLAVTVACVTVLWVAEPLYSKYAIDRLMSIRDGATVNLTFLFGMWAVIFVLLSVTQTAEKYLTWRTMNQTELDRSVEIYEHVLKLDIAFHTQQKSGEIVKVIDEGGENLASLQRNLIVDFVPSFLSAIAFLVIGFMIQPLLALILIVMIACFLVVVVIGTTKTMKYQFAANKAWVERIGRAYDAVTNIFSVKSGAQEAREVRLLEESNRRVLAAQLQVNKRWAAIEAINFFLLTRILLTAVGVYLFVKNVLTLGEMYFFQASFYRVLTPFEMLSGLMPFWNKQIGKVRLSEELRLTPVAVADASDGVRPQTVNGRIRLENISFSYDQNVKVIDLEEINDSKDIKELLPSASHDPEDQPEHKTTKDERSIEEREKDHPEIPADEKRTVLKNITLDIKPGEHVAFVGHSGAGKSTLAMLLNRFYDVTDGRITVDGVDIKDLDLRWWRSQIGLVLQDNLMFNDTVLANIRYARPDATADEVKEAARRAAADAFIEDMPKQYDTLVGDRGIKLSGGQRQRIAIARAILKQPTIVVLDEATSALDSVTERQVQEGIKELIQGRTACIIAHRLSTVRSVDRIAVFDKGELVAFAPHEELLKTSPIYKEMVELQSHGMLAE